MSPSDATLLTSPADAPRDWLTVSECADWLRVSMETMLKMVHCKTIPAILHGRTIRVSRRAVELKFGAASPPASQTPAARAMARRRLPA